MNSRGGFPPLLYCSFVDFTDILGPEHCNESCQDEVDRHNIIQYAWIDENNDAGNDRCYRAYEWVQHKILLRDIFLVARSLILL